MAAERKEGRKRRKQRRKDLRRRLRKPFDELAKALRRIRAKLRQAGRETALQVRRVKARPKAAQRGRVTVARVMGNDLYPRHEVGQMLRNLAFVLEHEPDLPGAEKLFILNRIFDPAVLAEAERLIAAHGASAHVIAFEPEAFAAKGWEPDLFGGPEYFRSPEFSACREHEQMRRRIWACRPKINYAMNINGARNVALRLGQERGEWTAVLDGNCIFSEASYAAFRRDAAARPFRPYVVLPMRRLDRNTEFAAAPIDRPTQEEPQIALHRAARLRFDERFPYGSRDKTSLLQALGVPGPWDKWSCPDWLPQPKPDRADRGFFKYSSGTVFRLSSGRHGMELPGSQRRRFDARNDAILATLWQLCAQHGTRDPELADLLLEPAGSQAHTDSVEMSQAVGKTAS